VPVTVGRSNTMSLAAHADAASSTQHRARAPRCARPSGEAAELLLITRRAHVVAPPRQAAQRSCESAREGA